MTTERHLFLDDDQDRHDAFAARYKDCQRTHVYSVSEFEKAIAEGSYDVVHLDHDLGDFTAFDMYDHREERTGFDAAKAMTSAPWTPKLVAIHSWNPDGAQKMYRLLREHGFTVMVTPFSFDV